MPSWTPSWSPFIMTFCYISLKNPPFPYELLEPYLQLTWFWKTQMLKMLLDKRITDLFSSSCSYKCPIKQKRDTVLKIGRGRRNKRIVENTFSPKTWERKIKGFQKTDVFNRREHARHMWLKKPLNFVWVILINCIFLKHISQIFRFFSKRCWSTS